jgi:hypothetical protein
LGFRYATLYIHFKSSLIAITPCYIDSTSLHPYPT